MNLKEVDLHLTNKCNMQCRHCIFSSGQRIIEEMPVVDIKRFINDFAKLTKYNGVLNLFGGEVFLYPSIFEIIDLASRLGLAVGLTINGQVYESLIRRLSKQKISRITIDLEAGESDLHDWLRNKEGSFVETINTIKLFKDLNFYTTVNVVLFEKNLKNIIDILNLCKKINIDALAFYFFTPLGRGRGISNMMIGPKKWLSTKEKIIKWINKNKPNFDVIWECAYDYVSSQSDPKAWRCGTEHRETIFIRCDGEAYPCALLEDTPCSLGNLRDNKLTAILKNRENFILNRQIGCPALAFHHDGDLSGVDPRPCNKNIKPACPYDYQILTRNQDLHEKYRRY